MPHSDNLYYQFGPYQFDVGNRILTRNGETISLTHKATDILIMLISNAGQIVEKDELLTKVWADTFVEEANLTQNIFILRRALGDDRTGPKYIETVARRGYRFIGPVRVSDVPKAHNGDSAVSDSLATVVAVLPFLNNTGDPEFEYLANGLTDNIINNLSRVSRLRVMSRSAVVRYQSKEIDPRQSGRELGANAVFVGKITGRPSGLTIAVELVDVTTGWQLWGESFDSECKDLLQIQGVITKQLLATLKLKLTGEEERQVTARYTDNSEAYQSYLEGRYHWSRYTKKGIEKAIQHFRRAIELDPNYALAYAAIVDCYLRLATNYLPPEPDTPEASIVDPSEVGGSRGESDPRVKLRFEWDWKGAERELRRANDLKTNYPAAHQWYAAYRFSLEIFKRSLGKNQFSADIFHDIQATQLYSGTLSPNEEVQILCTVAREQIEVGNYDAGCLILEKHWMPGEWPKIDGLRSHSAADLLFTTGSLAGCLSSTGRIPKGQKHAEALLSGSIGIFDHLGANRAVAEAKIELALSYYRQGMFELARKTLLKLIEGLQARDNDLRSIAFIRLAVVERQAGHITDSLSRLSAASDIVNQGGPSVTGRYYQELANALEEDITTSENRSDYLKIVQNNFARAYYEFEAIGHVRYTAVAENNHGYSLLKLGYYDDAEVHLLRAQRLFGQLDDKIRRAQVNDCLGRLYMATNRFELAESAIDSAIASLEADDEEALLAEALTTKGRLFCKQHRYNEARQILEGAWRIAERCGDNEGAGRALLILVEEMHSQIGKAELNRIIERVCELLENTQQASTRARLAESILQLGLQQTDQAP